MGPWTLRRRAGDRPARPANTSRRARSDAGSTSLTVALLTPMFVVLMFAAVQAALWGHARTEARVVARDTAVLVARSQVAPGAAQSAAVATLGDTDLTDIKVGVTSTNGLVIVRIDAQAPGIIIGTSRGVSVTEAVPIEELTP